MQEPRSPDEGRGGHGPHPEHDGHEAATTDDTLPTPHDLMGHGGHGAMSMEDMVADMRRRFLVAALFSVPILLWSPIGRDVIGFEADAPFGLRDDVFMLLLSLPVIFYAAWIFFAGAVRAPPARTLALIVLVAVAVGAGWLSVGRATCRERGSKYVRISVC